MRSELFLEVVAGVWAKKKLFADYWNAERITPPFIALVACFVSL
jgi:hypothetical protein